MFHNSQAVLALSKEPNPTVFQKTLGLNDFYLASDEFDHPLGNIQMVGKSQAEMYRGEKPIETKLAPTFALRDIAEHAVDFWLSTEDLPRPDNRVTLAQDGNVQLAYEETNHKASQELYHKLRSMLGHLGMHPDHLVPRHAYLKTAIPVAGVRPPGRHVPVRPRPGDVGRRHRLPGPRGRQPLRGRHQHLPQHRRGEPGAHGDGQRPARRRPPARPARDGMSALSLAGAHVLAVDPVPWARAQMAFTLASHIILVPLGVSWACMTLVANWRAIKRDDHDALLLAQRWSKYMAVTFAVGAVTGTVLSFEFGLLWPEFMAQWGAVFGIPFAVEGLFFFVEAIFIAIYIFGWKRLRPWPHFWTGVPIVLVRHRRHALGRSRPTPG